MQETQIQRSAHFRSFRPRHATVHPASLLIPFLRWALCLSHSLARSRIILCTHNDDSNIKQNVSSYGKQSTNQP